MTTRLGNSWEEKQPLWVTTIKNLNFLSVNMKKLQITLLGFRGEVLDLEVEIAQPPKAIEEESKLVDEILQTNGMTSTGRLFKIGVQIANAAVVTKAGKKQIQLNEQKKLF